MIDKTLTPTNELWNRKVGKVIDSICKSDALKLLACTVGSVIDYDKAAAILYYNNKTTPKLIFSDSEAFPEYFGSDIQTGMYQTDPIFLQLNDKIDAGLYRHSEFYNGEYCKSKFSLKLYTDYGLLDEAIYLVPINQEQYFVLVFIRTNQNSRFREGEWETFKSISPIITSIMRQYHLIHTSNSAETLERALSSFGFDILTERERQVARLILEGHCSKEISGMLNIAYGTVKIHRKNLYAKLGVSSHSQLFSTFLQGME